MNGVIVGFILGFVVATVGFGNLSKYIDNSLQKSQTVLKENVK